MYNIQEQLITINRSHVGLVPLGMGLHCTDTPNATAQNERDAFNTHPEFEASAHAFIDASSIILTVPTNERAWHAGPTANRLLLGVELCMARNESEFEEIWNRAVWLFANWMVNIVKVTTITPDNLMSHAEISSRWHETTHTDPIAYFKQYGKTVDMFRADVQAAINGQVNNKPKLSVNSEALELQHALNRLKMRDAKGNGLEEDGIIGGRTKEAVKRFQSICGLTVDGIAGPNTNNAINEILSKPLLQINSRGVAVKYLQHRVGTSNDGIFGWGTNRAVAIWQGQNDLSQDGKVGPKTWAKLIG